MSATNRGSERRPQDLYPTPAHVIDALMPYIDLTSVHSFLEPCIGTGVIAERFANVPHREWAEKEKGRDYLSMEFFPVDLIVTNPPYSLAREFLLKSLDEAQTVIYLLRVSYLGSNRRLAFWQEHPPTHMFTIVPRPSFVNGGTDATEYAWFAWDRGDLILTQNTLNWLDTRPHKVGKSIRSAPLMPPR